MADLYNPLAGVRGTGLTYNDLLASRPGTRDAFAQQLMQMLSGIKPTTYTYRGANPDANNVDPSRAEVDLTGYRADILDQLFGGADKGGYTLNRILEAQPSYGYTFSTGQLRDPYQANNHVGRWIGNIDANGNLGGLRWKNDSTTTSLVDRIGNFATDWGPALVLAAATAGAGGLAGLGGGASAAPAAPIPLPMAGPGDLVLSGSMSTLPQAGSPWFYMGDVAAGAAGGAAASDIASAAGQPELGLAPQTAGAESAAGAAPISASTPSTVASPFKIAMDAVKPYASLIGPATSLIGAATAQAPQMPQNAAARIPGVEAPPEARGLDRQAARSPILDVLGRNRRSNRNPTLLTGPGGVSMESVRVGGNTLLGM